MKTLKGPALFLAQFAGDAAPFNTWGAITKWAADCGYVGVQIPSWDARLIDLDKAASSQAYCDEIKGVAAEAGITVTELSTHLQGQLVAVHPAYDTQFDGFAAAVGAGQSRGARRMGGGAGEKGAECLEEPWPDGAGDVFRRAGLALPLSLAAAAGGAGRGGFRRAGPALAADPRPCRGDAASTSATRSIPARICTTA